MTCEVFCILSREYREEEKEKLRFQTLVLLTRPSVWQQDNTRTTQPNFTGCAGAVDRGPRKNRLHFGGDPLN